MLPNWSRGVKSSSMSGTAISIARPTSWKSISTDCVRRLTKIVPPSSFILFEESVTDWDYRNDEGPLTALPHDGAFLYRCGRAPGGFLPGLLGLLAHEVSAQLNRQLQETA